MDKISQAQGIHGQNKSNTRYTWTKQVKHKVYMDKIQGIHGQGIHGQNKSSTRYTWTKQVKHKVNMDKTSQEKMYNKSTKQIEQI